MSSELPRQFRKLRPSVRIDALQKCFSLSDEERSLLSPLCDRADAMVEASIGTFALPFGIATGFLINGEKLIVPMVTEEPSVIAAATYAGLLIQTAGGIEATADLPLIAAQIFIENGSSEEIGAKREEIAQRVNGSISGIVKRGGGFHDLTFERLPSGILSITIELHVCDLMGANVANSVAEEMKSYFSQLTGGRVIMAIVTNSCRNRQARASFALPERLMRGGASTARRIVQANQIAEECSDRAVTHNKGIMNGISALALATGNDTRAIEAAAHHFACQKPLTTYTFKEGVLCGAIQLPLPFGTAGGAMQSWPPAQLSLKLLRNPSAQKLSQIAAALGLAQNFAALYALVTEGIQAGHMKLHSKRHLYSSGAQ